MLDGVYRCGADGLAVFVEAPAPSDEALQAVLYKIITRLMGLLTRQGVLVEEAGSTYVADNDSDSDEARGVHNALHRTFTSTQDRSDPVASCTRSCRSTTEACAPQALIHFRTSACVGMRPLLTSLSLITRPGVDNRS